MNYSNALRILLEDRRIIIDELAEQMYVKPNWIKKILNKPTWKPRLDTVLHFCYCLDVNVFDFLKACHVDLSNSNTIISSSIFQSKCKRQRYLIINLKSKHIAYALFYYRNPNSLSVVARIPANYCK